MDSAGRQNGASRGAPGRMAQLLAQSESFERLGQQLNSATTTKAAARIIVEVADKLFGWDACTLSLYSRESDTTFPILEIDTIKGRRVDVTSDKKTRGPTARGRLVMTKGAQLILRRKPVFDAGLIPFGDTSRPSGSIMVVPIRHGPNVAGLLSIQSYVKNAYTQESLATLQALADYCGGALDRIRTEAALRESEAELQRSKEQLRALAARLQDVREAECLRISREIHDVFGEALTSLNMELVRVQKRIAREKNRRLRAETRQPMSSMAALLQTTVASVQQISSDLRPGLLDDLGLAAALEWQAADFAERMGIPCRWQRKCWPLRSGCKIEM